LTHDECMLLS